MNYHDILDFYKTATSYENLTKLSLESRHFQKRHFFDYSNIETTSLSDNKIVISINKQLSMYLVGNRGISPIKMKKNTSLSKTEAKNLEEIIEQELFELDIDKDSKEWQTQKIILEQKLGLKEEQNSLLMAPVYIKAVFPEEETTIFIPLMTMDISEHKFAIKNHDYRKSNYTMEIDIENTPLQFNEFATNLLLDSSFKEIQSSILYVANSDSTENTKDLFKKIYKNIKNHLLQPNPESLKIEVPDLNVSNEPLCLFFNKTNDPFFEIEFNKLKKSNNPLLIDYLTKESKNKTSSCEVVFFGTMTPDFPLSSGQAQVLSKNHENNRMISVMGPPGTGKTTLFKSIIANEVTKRALSNIYNKEDYANLTLITSTSNKAIENIYQPLKKVFSSGFCYVGGNYQNKIESAQEIEDLIEVISASHVNDGELERLEIEIKSLVDKISTAASSFLSLKEEAASLFQMKSITDITKEHLKKPSKIEVEDAMETISEFKELVEELSEIVGKFLNLEDVISFSQTKDAETIVNTAKKAAKQSDSFFALLFNLPARTVKKMKISDKTFLVKEPSKFYRIASILSTTKKYKTEIEDSMKILKTLMEVQKKEEFIKKNEQKLMLFDKYESFSDFYRKELFLENNKLFMLSKKYLEQKAIKNKYATIEALRVLASGDFYGVSNHEEVLKRISMIYPVITSTIAGFKFMFKNLNTDTPFKTALADEAGMIKVQDMLPIMARANRAVVVGDPKQFKPIVQMHYLFDKFLETKAPSKEFFEKYSPTRVSAFHRAAGTKDGKHSSTGDSVLLDEHRRCQQEIAEIFISAGEYDGVKIVTPPKPIEDIAPFSSRKVFINVINRNKKQKNVNEKEVEAIEKILNILDKSDNFDIEKDVCIITPYLSQEELLKKRFKNTLNHSNQEKKIGTIHKFQGAEFKVVIFSPVVSAENDSLKFINKDPSLVTVVTSRAKELLIVVGDYEKVSGLEPGNYIGRVADMMKDNVKQLDSLSF